MSVVNLLTNAVAAGAGSLLGSQVSLRAACLRRPRPMPHQFGPLLDHSLRMRYRDVGETLGMFGLSNGQIVLDLGCGTGTFTVEMARMVGEQGLVHAADLQQPFLEQTRARLDDAGLADRVRLHHCGAYNIPLVNDSCDLAVMIATLSQIPDISSALFELRRILKPGARLAIGEELPDPAYRPSWSLKQRAEEAGFVLQAKTGNFFCYNMIFTNDKDLVEKDQYGEIID